MRMLCRRSALIRDTRALISRLSDYDRLVLRSAGRVSSLEATKKAQLPRDCLPFLTGAQTDQHHGADAACSTLRGKGFLTTALCGSGQHIAVDARSIAAQTTRNST
jgi:hypothetical protein